MNSRRFAYGWLTVWFVAAIVFAGRSPAFHLPETLAPMSATHPLGADAFGRDLLQLTLNASLSSAFFAAGAMAITLTASLFLGTAIASAPSAVQFASLRTLDLVMAFPPVLFALAWAAIRGPSRTTLLTSLIVGALPGAMRLCFARAREVMNEEFVIAAHSLGASPARILIRHIGPSVFGLCIILAPNLFAHALMAEATLTFIGVGAPMGDVTWGALLAQGKEYLIEAPHLAVGSGVPLLLTVLSLQLISERLVRTES